MTRLLLSPHDNQNPCQSVAKKHRQMHPPQLLELIWHFGRESAPQEAAYDLHVSRDTVQDAFHKFRLDLESFMFSLSGGKLGCGPERVVVVDVTERTASVVPPAFPQRP